MPLFHRNTCNRGSPQLRRLIPLAAFLSSFFLAASANAATYYVATNGSDSNPGTEASPWKTIAHAVSRMNAGDTTYVRGGTYDEDNIRFSKSGTSSAPIKLLNAPGESPIVDFGVGQSNLLTVHRFEFQSAAGHKEPIGWIVLEGFEIRNGYDGIKYYNLHDSVIRRNNIHHNVAQGIKGNGGQRVLIDRNIIHTNGDFIGCANGRTQAGNNNTICNLLHGMYIDGNDVTITNNLIYNNLAAGVVINGSSGESHNWLVANNVFAYQYWAPAITVWGSRTDNTKIINNIFYENSSGRSTSATNGIWLYASSPAKGIVINNNISYATGSGGTKFIGDGYNSYTEGVHYTQSGNITANPNFEDAGPTISGVPNFKLRAGSPAIDKGQSLSQVTWDHAGGKRPFGAAFDIGAYEFGSPPDSGSPPPNPTGGGGSTPPGGGGGGSGSGGGLSNCAR